MFWIVIISLGVAWLLQSFFSFKQSQAFGKLFVELRRKGRVAMGRFKGGLVQGVIVLFAIDDDGIILEGHKLQGVTVGARFKRFDLYDGQDLHEIDPHLAKRHGGPALKAIENARENLRIVTAGGQPPEPPSALTRLIRRLPTPRFLQERKKAKPAPAAAVIPMAPEKARIKVSRTTRSGG
ncbi:MAG TPA: transcriptional regulator GutM [Arachnia sp.]|jgi:DNA-binding transcriptional regulator of glucitol operon|nr:transcriptional regulator GutM [Propionibacteriaceae bacterium]HMS37248.1 transcriptional regulator GutM [Arachnia sp.]HOA27097.1 transcriptional regulator GutM [Arachnia sp.]HQD22039.1 transcriptional regulator GutM [Arachnia sp.]